ncbi:MAG: PCRF domain-containing protein [bacterium]
MKEENKEIKQQRIKEIEEQMNGADFWTDKEKAQILIKELQDLKNTVEGGSPFDSGDAVLTIFSGAGGIDSEDFASMLLSMYEKYVAKKGWGMYLIHENKNDHGGIRNTTFEIKGKNAYGTLKNESGVHRLVRLSPFNSKSLRHTSFAMVEVIPKFEKKMNVEIPDTDLKIEFTKSSGPGGQNVNKRETAVRIVHIPTKVSVHVDSERSQGQNKEKAMEILKGKLYIIFEAERNAKEKGMQISKTTDVEWGNQIRSYVLHPYKMVKDHRTNVETANTEAVLNGDIEKFIEAEKNLG